MYIYMYISMFFKILEQLAVSCLQSSTKIVDIHGGDRRRCLTDLSLFRLSLPSPFLDFVHAGLLSAYFGFGALCSFFSAPEQMAITWVTLKAPGPNRPCF